LLYGSSVKFDPGWFKFRISPFKFGMIGGRTKPAPGGNGTVEFGNSGVVVEAPSLLVRN